MSGWRKPIALAVALATVGLASVLASNALAGVGPDPRIGDVQLGRQSAIAYVKDAETVVDTGSTLASTGCPGKGEAWRIAGGGFDVGRAFNDLNMSRPLDYLDADAEPDDYWEVESNSARAGTKITSYAVCMKQPKLEYATGTAANSPPDAERTLSVDCPGKTKPIGGGGSISHSDSFLSSLYPSGKTWTVTAHDADAGMGNFTADAVCLNSKRVETVKTNFRVAANSDRNVKVLGEAPAMPMGTVYQDHRGSFPGIPGQPVFESVPFDGRDKDKIPEDGWKVGLSNTSSESMKVTLYSTFYTPPGS